MKQPSPASDSADTDPDLVDDLEAAPPLDYNASGARAIDAVAYDEM